MSTVDHYEEIIFEISWILTNITSIDNSQLMEYILKPEYKLIDFLKRILSHKNKKIKEHSIWCLSNLLEGTENNYKIVFDTNIIEEIRAISGMDKIPLGLSRVVAWCCSNICKWKVRTKEFILTMVDIIATIIFIADEEVLSDWWYAFKHLTDIEEPDRELEKIKLESIGAVEVLEKIVSIIERGKMSFSAALRFIGNISAADSKIWDEQVLKAGFFQKGKI